MTGGEAWELFWAGSGLTPATAPAFGERLAAFAPGDEGFRLCTFPAGAVPLRRPDDRLSRLTDRRRSGRAFGPGALSLRQLGSLLGALAARPDGSRAYPSAGALYPLEVFCLAGEVEGGLAATVGCYNPRGHSLTPVGPLPPWPEWSGALNLVVEGVPQLVVVFVLLTEQVVAKYGDLGGRLALVEVGHAAQNLALRLAADGLVGCEAGGVVEPDLLPLLRLDGTPARVALAYACGLPPR
jgi:SagB-type dehydrogenase family enzyme